MADTLATSVILGCDFCDRHVEAIRSRQRKVEMNDGTTVPIISKPTARASQSPPLPEEQQFVPLPGKVSNKIQVHERTYIPSETQAWVQVTTQKEGLILVDSLPKLYENDMCLAGAGVTEVEPNKLFQILVANFGKHRKLLLPKQQVATAKPHPTTLVESNISHAEMLGLISDEEANGNRKNLFRKRDFNAKDISLINNHLADDR